MPLRQPHPKIFQVLVKTHKLTIFLTLPNETAISVVKEQVLSAFLDDVFKDIRDVPRVAGLDDFVLSREVIERGQHTSFEVLTNDQLLRDVVGNWAVLFVQFKDDSDRLQPVEVTIPSLTDDEDEISGTPNARINLAMDIDDTLEESSVRKGKRKVVD